MSGVAAIDGLFPKRSSALERLIRITAKPPAGSIYGTLADYVPRFTLPKAKN